ncbi:MAG: hypothetical protein R3F38_06080 [Gammaproteobacteria bacterium]
MSDASPDLKHLQQQIPLCLSRDRYRLSRQVQTISERQKRQQPVDQDLQKLGNAIERSRAAVQARKDSLPLLEYPDLPVSQRRDDIVAAIRQHQVVIIAGKPAPQNHPDPQDVYRSGAGAYRFYRSHPAPATGGPQCRTAYCR